MPVCIDEILVEADEGTRLPQTCGGLREIRKILKTASLSSINRSVTIRNLLRYNEILSTLLSHTVWSSCHRRRSLHLSRSSGQS